MHKFTSNVLCSDQRCVWGEWSLFLQLPLTYITTAFQQCRNYMAFNKSLQILFPRL